jgi:hypothetical protein
MHRLPFGTQLTDALVRILRHASVQCLDGHSDFLPDLTWCTSFRNGQPVEHWAISAFSRSYMRDEFLFTVDGVTICIGPEAQARATGHVLDWRDGVGVVQIDTPET